MAVSCAFCIVVLCCLHAVVFPVVLVYVCVCVCCAVLIFLCALPFGLQVALCVVLASALLGWLACLPCFLHCLMLWLLHLMFSFVSPCISCFCPCLDALPACLVLNIVQKVLCVCLWNFGGCMQVQLDQALLAKGMLAILLCLCCSPCMLCSCLCVGFVLAA